MDNYLDSYIESSLAHESDREYPDMHKPMGYAGLVQTRRNRIIPGAWLSLYRATPACLDPSGGEWVTVCEAHGTLCNHETRRLAESHLSYADWCEECQDLVSK